MESGEGGGLDKTLETGEEERPLSESKPAFCISESVEGRPIKMSLKLSSSFVNLELAQSGSVFFVDALEARSSAVLGGLPVLFVRSPSSPLTFGESSDCENPGWFSTPCQALARPCFAFSSALSRFLV